MPKHAHNANAASRETRRENESEDFRHAFEIAVMNPEFKASHIEDISNRDFVMKHISSLYEEVLIRRIEPYYTQSKSERNSKK